RVAIDTQLRDTWLFRTGRQGPSTAAKSPPGVVGPGLAGLLVRFADASRWQRRHQKPEKSQNMSAKPIHIVSLPGDGIGPEVCREALRVLEIACGHAGRTLDVVELPIG